MLGGLSSQWKKIQWILKAESKAREQRKRLLLSLPSTLNLGKKRRMKLSEYAPEHLKSTRVAMLTKVIHRFLGHRSVWIKHVYSFTYNYMAIKLTMSQHLASDCLLYNSSSLPYCFVVKPHTCTTSLPSLDIKYKTNYKVTPQMQLAFEDLQNTNQNYSHCTLPQAYKL